MSFAMAKARIGTTMREALLTPRQDNNDRLLGESNREVPFWWTKTGIIVKWSIFLGFLVIFTAYVLGGYMHAKRRIRKGLKPLGYHRWLLPRAELARVDPRYAYPQANYTNYAQGPGYYGMQAMPPPPVYDPNRPPMYEGGPPMGATKLDPAQTGNYAPPPGPPPPAAVRPERTGNSNPFSDPSR
ncbi:hypothetical protein BJ170DRAFT_413683 [Xylariales sp. AK1849]|nr:hypothetical protein BJ170DRAFT_413683 [Xylariales sp. AK1849]